MVSDTRRLSTPIMAVGQCHLLVAAIYRERHGNKYKREMMLVNSVKVETEMNGGINRLQQVRVTKTKHRSKNVQTFVVAEVVVKGKGLGLSRKLSTDLTFLTESGGQVGYMVSASCRHISRARLRKRWGIR